MTEVQPRYGRDAAEARLSFKAEDVDFSGSTFERNRFEGVSLIDAEGVSPLVIKQTLQECQKLLQSDNLWKGHIKSMNFVKDFAGLKVYAQEDPLDVYRVEGLALFEQMQKSLCQNAVYSFFMYQPRA